jgi:3-deoxy-manno-octulosonate cytidylyltransferase (CMP-KDO synthetase)
MLLHVCDNARESGASFVLVATDDARIEQVARAAGVGRHAHQRRASFRHRSPAEVIERRRVPHDSIIVNVAG